MSSARIFRSRTTSPSWRAPRSPRRSIAQRAGSASPPRTTASTGEKPNSKTHGSAGNTRERRFPDLHETLAHGEPVEFVADSNRAAIEVGHRPAHVMLRVEYQEGVLQLADVLVRAVDLHRMREAREQDEHARAVALQMLGVVQHHIDTPRAARVEEALQALDARRVVQAQCRAVGIEDAQLTTGLREQAVHGGLEAGAGVEPPVARFAHHDPFTDTSPRRCQSDINRASRAPATC